MTFSTLSGNSDSTSFFNRRRRKGRRTLWRRLTTRRASSSFISIFSPPVLANGALNQSSNDLTELKILGRTKLSSAQSSGKLFWGSAWVSACGWASLPAEEYQSKSTYIESCNTRWASGTTSTWHFSSYVLHRWSCEPTWSSTIMVFPW